MLSKSWRIVLLVVALAAMLWPDLIGASTWWISLISATVLLINEITAGGDAMKGHVKIRRK